jgi:hypothetical protein
MIGPPGGGKSMLAERLPGLLPDLSPRAALEVSMVHSVAGLLEGGRLVTRPPFRAPHHSASMAAISGGGNRARPGEVSLAHRGVLFMDEMPEFPRATLEALRQPLEAGQTTVARAAAHVTYPARFQLIGALNPCRCGYLGDGARECGRAPRCGEDYQSRLSGPLLDRIDLIVEITPLSPKELSWAPPGEDSATAMARRGRRPMPRRRAIFCASRRRRKTSWKWRRRNCASRHAALPVPCGSAAPSPTSPAGRRCTRTTSPRRWLIDSEVKQPLFKKSGAKIFGYAGPWALSAPTPTAQINKVFLLLFVHKK